MRATTLMLRNRFEVAACIRAITDYVEMSEDMRKEPVLKLASLSGSAFNECLDEINAFNHSVSTGRQLVAALRTITFPQPNAEVPVFLSSADVAILTAGLEMDTESASEMEPFYRLLNNAPKGAGVVFTRETIEKLKDEVEEAVAKLVAMKDVLARLK